MKTKGHNNFTSDDIFEVWASIDACAGKKYCIDPMGRKMDRRLYGHKSEFGWDIDHVLPISAGGTNEISNLQPLNWLSNKEKGTKRHCEKWGRC